MKRAYLMELTVLKDYLKQLAVLGLLVSVFVSVITSGIVGMSAIMTMMFLVTGSMSASAYDEANGWGAFRLTLPVSRRDVVLARYAFVLTVALLSACIGVLVFLALGLTAEVLPLSGDMAAGMELSVENVSAALFAFALCLTLGCLVVGLTTPIYFRFGQTKASQIIPLLALMFAMGGGGLAMGMLDNVSAEGVAGLLSFVETPAGLACSLGVALVASAAILLASAAVSLKLYATREL